MNHYSQEVYGVYEKWGRFYIPVLDNAKFYNKNQEFVYALEKGLSYKVTTDFDFLRYSYNVIHFDDWFQSPLETELGKSLYE
ncbi:MAG: hypothetical protein HC836_45285 [Richelia sp. RM2_1_2]|nr:hypothetical protein [Richelia sp. RM2_1_2]